MKGKELIKKLEEKDFNIEAIVDKYLYDLDDENQSQAFKLTADYYKEFKDIRDMWLDKEWLATIHDKLQKLYLNSLGLGEITITRTDEIDFEEFDLEIYKGSKLDGYWAKEFKDVKIEKDGIYSIKRWKPFYKLANGVVIKYDFQIYKKVEDKR